MSLYSLLPLYSTYILLALSVCILSHYIVFIMPIEMVATASKIADEILIDMDRADESPESNSLAETPQPQRTP